jgi:hypothetical protein
MPFGKPSLLEWMVIVLWSKKQHSCSPFSFHWLSVALRHRYGDFLYIGLYRVMEYMLTINLRETLLEKISRGFNLI